jgi:dihydrofolate reductase
MRPLIVSTFVTLDGVMQAPGGPEEDPAGGFDHGGWSAGYWDEAMGERMGELMGKPFDLLLGRKTYEIFAAHWPHVPDEPGAAQLNGARKYVASRTLDTVEWENSTLLEGDVPGAVAKLKERKGRRSMFTAAGT